MYADPVQVLGEGQSESKLQSITPPPHDGSGMHADV